MSDNKSFTPQLFNNLGKSVKDLFKKKYEFDNTFKVVNKSTAGFTVESLVTQSKKSGLRGQFTASQGVGNFGTLDSKVQTDAAQESSVALKLKTNIKGANAKFTYQTKDKDAAFKRGLLVADVDYSRESVALAAQFKSDLEVTKGEISAVLGYDNLSVGAKAELDTSSLSDWNLAVEYSKDDVTATLQTEKQRSVVSASYYQKWNANQVVGATVRSELSGKQARSLTLGSDYRLDADTTLRSKSELNSADTSSLLFSSAVEHRFAKPNLLLAVACSFKLTGAKVEPVDLGVAVTLGDF